MSVVNAGTARGALQLEDQFSGALDKFNSGMDDAKESAREMSRASESAADSSDDFMESVRELAKSMEAEAKAAVDAEEANRGLDHSSRDAAKGQNELEKEAKQAAAALEKERKEANSTAHEVSMMKDLFKATAAGFGITMGIEAAVGAVKDFVVSTVELGSKIQDLSDRAGLTTDQFQELQYAITQTGGRTEDVEKAVTKLNDKLTEGKKGTVKALESMGLELENIQAMKPGDAFLKVANAIGEIPDPMQRSQAAIELFGISGAKWLPAINQGLGDLQKEAHNLGQVLSEHDIQALDEFGDRWDQMMKRLQVSAAHTALTVADAFKSSFKDIVKSWVEEIQGLDTTSLAVSLGAALAKEADKNQSHGASGSWDDPAADAAAAKEKKRQEDIAKAQKEAAEEAKAWAKTVKAAYEMATGKQVQDTIKRTQQVLGMLTAEQRTNKKVVQELLKPYEDIRDKINDLPPDIEKVRNEYGKKLTVDTDLFAQITRSYTQLKPNIQNLQQQMNNLRADGLIPVHDVTGKVATAMDGLALAQHNVAVETKSMGEVFEETFKRFDIGERMVEALADGLKSGDMAKAIGNVAHLFNDALTSSFTTIAKSKMGSTWGGIVGGIYGQVVGFMIDQAINEFGNSKERAAAKLQAKQMYNDILGQFGGSQRQMTEQLSRAGVGPLLQSKIKNEGTGPNRSPGQLQEDWEKAREALNKYATALNGLNSALEGVSKISTGIFKSFGDSAKTQLDAVLAGQKLVIDAMIKEGATEEELDQRRAYFADLNKDRTFTATNEQIEQFNRLGTIAGGVIVNIAGRTGDMVAAFRAASDTLDPMLEISKQFDLHGRVNAATEEVLKFYSIIKNNSDVFDAVQGVGQVLNGLGDAAIRNADLVNALGHELEDSALKLQAQGVSVHDIYAMLSPQLQDLWETVKDGKLTVDETTQALLDQAEAQGVVGDNMRDVNEQILMVLTEIRDMFMQDLPDAVDEFTNHVENSQTQTGNAIRRTAQQAQSVWTSGMHRTNEQWVADTTGAAEKIKTNIHKNIPKDWPIDVKWSIEPLDLPDPDPYHVPVEYDVPDGPPPPPPPPDPGDPYTGAGQQTPGDTASARGNTTFILEDAGAPLVRVTAENLPGYVRLRGGNLVHSV